ncbi:MAG: tRNA pseudouridine synthase B [Microgenomates group bacterium GW2011_GWA2_46_16]|nr:MAG: tRNA pseudouridine synthase B [Microgenomates group bacterium GW2011_GWA2_46_16]
MGVMDAVLPVYKPTGITSFDVIRVFKRAVSPDYKVGHGGTLDPFADGVLLLLLGKATKKMNELSTLPKTYRAVARLGARSDTLDVTGAITPGVKGSHTPGVLEIRETAKKFVGEIVQEIPDYSATKINGVPRYKLARRGEVMERKSKVVTIYALEMEKVEDKLVTFTSTVSSGTYIRQLSYDMFRSLGTESYLESLTRTRIGDFAIDKCCKIELFESGGWEKYVTMF